ncbi:hypothetical protein GUJ93_ZPchr0012g21790 [Zizania palustris]|uniref:Uncharacterized protein n=1 Tax=Zizania palustris TaxID=103762 RepID=A0A8J6BWJ0_ZIZPA|nr:hypothetical protein GUJ93_ZPchr0012g21790 [Zizania palustris]
MAEVVAQLVMDPLVWATFEWTQTKDCRSWAKELLVVAQWLIRIQARDSLHRNQSLARDFLPRSQRQNQAPDFLPRSQRFALARRQRLRRLRVCLHACHVYQIQQTSPIGASVVSSMEQTSSHQRPR